jgi:transcriptional regulator GlxA family with amidase domain
MAWVDLGLNFSPKLHYGDEPILKVQQWLQNSDVISLIVTTMAAKARMGERTFLRRFQKATGLTPTEYVQQLSVGRLANRLSFHR